MRLGQLLGDGKEALRQAARQQEKLVRRQKQRELEREKTRRQQRKGFYRWKDGKRVTE